MEVQKVVQVVVVGQFMLYLHQVIHNNNLKKTTCNLKKIPVYYKRSNEFFGNAKHRFG
jgi:hypothetical protein